MIFRALLAVSCLVGSTAAIQAQGQRHKRQGLPYGSHVTAPSATASSTSSGYSARSSLSPVVTANASSYRPTGTGLTTSLAIPPVLYQGHIDSATPCSGGATLNVLSASLDWWWTATYNYAISTFSIQLDRHNSATAWTLLPATTPFNLAETILLPTYTSYPYFNTFANQTEYSYSYYSTATPVAASTTIITQTAVLPVHATTGTGDIPNVATTPAPASVVVPSGGRFATGTPFVFFSAYEIIQPTKVGSGDACTPATTTYTMPTPFSFEYGGNFDGSLAVSADVTGDVNPAFLGIVGQTTASAGSWVAAPTVVVVVEARYAAQAVLAAHTEQSQSSLQLPAPTLPPVLSSLPPGPSDSVVPITAHVESTVSYLVVPSPTSCTIASATGAGDTLSTTSAGVGGLVSAILVVVGGTSQAGTTDALTILSQAAATDALTILSQAAATNALEVLSQAAATLPPPPQNAAVGAQSVNSNAPGSPPQNSGGNPVVVPIGGGQITATPGSPVVVAGTTIQPGQVATVSGTVVSVGSTAIVVGATTHPFGSGPTVGPGAVPSSGPQPTPAPGAAPVLTIGGSTITAASSPDFVAGTPNAGTTYMVSGQTLTPGGDITFTGTGGVVETVSLASNAQFLVDAISGISRTSMLDGMAQQTAHPLLTIGSQTFTALAGGGATYVVDEHTIVPGAGFQTVVIGGQTYILSLSPSATVLEMEMLGPNGQITATSFETLFSQSMTQRQTMTGIAVNAHGTSTAGPSATGGIVHKADVQGGAPNLAIRGAAIIGAFGSLTLAMLL